MKRFTAVLAVAAVALLLCPPRAAGQYYTPLRYDLRYTSPTYIPSGALRYGPPRQNDPYRFGAPLHGNLAVTGNLRLGKSFQGSSPYRATGSQVARDLPSTRLSDFRRDSIGIEDLGTGLEYGRTEAYYPGSASVTTPWTAGQRFRVPPSGDRARYVPPNLNQSPNASSGPADNVFTSSGGWRGITLEGQDGAADNEIPEATLQYLESVVGGPVPWLPDREEGKGDAGGTQTSDRPSSPYDVFEKQFEADPLNLFREDRKPAKEAEGDSPETGLRLNYTPEATDMDPWVLPEEDEESPYAERSGRATDEPASPYRRLLEAEEAEEVGRWPPSGTGGTTSSGKTRKPMPPVPVATKSRYGGYVLRGHEAMKEGAYGKAEALYSAARGLDPDRPAAFFGRVHALLGSRLYLQAALVLGRGLKAHPEWVKHTPDIEAVFPERDVYRRIVADVRKELGAATGAGAHRFLLGYLEYATGNAEQAREYLGGEAGASEKTPEQMIIDAIGSD